MNQKEFLAFRREETPKTLRLLEMYPEEKSGMRPAENTRTAIELASTFYNEERACRAFVDDTPLSEVMTGERPKTIAEMVKGLRQKFDELNAIIEKLPDDRWNAPIEFFGRRIPLNAALFIMLCDHIHHRGQFSIYSRIAGGRVPRIYGPSADEPMA